MIKLYKDGNTMVDKKELSDKELEKVSGGFGSVTLFNFEKGDSFSTGSVKYMVLNDYKNVEAGTKIEVLRVYGPFMPSETEVTVTADIFCKENYLGKFTQYSSQLHTFI